MSLMDSEKSALAKKVGSTASIMASSVVKLYLASPNPKANKKDPNSVLKSFPDLSDSQWKYTNVMGALVLVVDRVLDTFLFRIYDLEHPHELRFEYELYEDIEYKALDPQFHSFEMDDCVGGFSFSNKDEAPKFLSKVNALRPTSKSGAIDALKGKKKEKSGWFSSGSKKKEKLPEISVSTVTNVTHTQHIGINPDGTFDLNNISPEWKALFRQAGIKKKDLANPETAKAIVATIAQTTGMQIRSDPAPQQAIDPSSEAAKEMYTPDQLKELEEYQSAMRKYEEELAAYEAEQSALAAWERDNAKYLAEKEEKERKERDALAVREREKREREEAERQKRDLEDLAAQQRALEAELAAKEKERQEAEAEKARLLQEAANKGAKLPPPPPPRKAAVPHIQAPVVENEPPAMPRRRTSVVQRVVHAVVGPKEDELAREEEERRKAEEERRKMDEDRRKRNAEELERLRQEEEKRLGEERIRIRAEMEAQMRAEEDMIRKAAEEERRKMREEALQEQERLQRELAEAKSAAEKARIEAAQELARQEAERARLEQEALEQKAAAERERARQAAEQAQREQEEILLQLQVMQLKTLEAKRLVEEEERRQEELRKEAAKKRAPPIPARLPDKPPLPPPPAAPPRPPMPPALPPLPGAPGEGAPKLPPAGGLANVLKGIGTVELRKTENMVDKSGPNITGKMGRDGQKNALLGALEKGVQLKKTDGGGAAAPKSGLPQLQKMESTVQNTIMAKLVETMNMRRGALAGNDSDDDDWSD